MLLVLAAWAAGAHAQDNVGATSPPKSSDTPAAQPAKASSDTKSDNKVEVSSHDTGTTFKLRVNLVQVRVVVRDKQGKLVDGLKREDFLLYDNGKLQTVSTFGVETAQTRHAKAEQAAKTRQGDESAGPPLVVMPQRFVALMFDDIHLNMQDASTIRVAAKKLIDSMTPTDRLAIYGTSGQITTEFTSDKAVLEQGLLRVIPRPKMGGPTTYRTARTSVTTWPISTSTRERPVGIKRGDTGGAAMHVRRRSERNTGGRPAGADVVAASVDGRRHG